MQKTERQKNMYNHQAMMGWNKFPVAYRVVKAAPAWISE